MTTNNLDSLSSNYLHPADYATKATGNSSADLQLSAFSQLLSSSASSSAAESSSKTSNPNQMLSQLMSSFQTSGIQNEGQSIDPMAIA